MEYFNTSSMLGWVYSWLSITKNEFIDHIQKPTCGNLVKFFAFYFVRSFKISLIFHLQKFIDLKNLSILIDPLSMVSHNWLNLSHLTYSTKKKKEKIIEMDSCCDIIIKRVNFWKFVKMNFTYLKNTIKLVKK